MGAPCLSCYSVRFPQLLAMRQGVVCVLVLFSLFEVVILAGAFAYPLCLAAAQRRLGVDRCRLPVCRLLCLPAFLLEWGEYVLVLFSLFVVVILAGALAYHLRFAAPL